MQLSIVRNLNLANRLRPLLKDPIFETQSAFILGRFITDNALIAFSASTLFKNARRQKIHFVLINLI
jgi:hypothetical protein